MDKLAELYVEVKLQTEQLKSELNTLKSQTTKTTQEMSNGFGGMAGGIAKVAIAAGLVKGAFDFLSDSVKQSRDAAIAMAQVENAIANTGGAAGYTSDELKRMADRLEETAGIDADEIMKDVTLSMLTFSKVQGEAFSRAQQSALDLSAVLGTDLKGAATLVGKALEDPIKGAKLLKGANILLTDSQKAQIKTLQEAGDLYGAQSIILDELEGKYKKQAETLNNAGGNVNNLGVAWDNLKETIGNALTPLLNDLIPAITKGIKGWISLFETTQDRLNRIRQETGDALKTALSDDLSKQSKEQLAWTQQNAKETLDANNATIKANEKLIAQKKTEFRWSDSEINALEEKNKTLKNSNVLYDTQLKVIDRINNPIKVNTENTKEKVKVETKSLNIVEQTVKKIQDLFANNKLIGDALKKDNLTLIQRNALLDQQLKLTKEINSTYIDAQARGVDNPNVDEKGNIIVPTQQVQPTPEIAKGLEPALTKAEQLQLDVDELNESIAYGGSAAAYTFADAMSEAVTPFKQANSLLQQMINSFAQAITQAIALKVAMAAIDFATGGIGGLIGGLFGAKGGTFQDGKKVASFAGGGSFIVPPGYNNDSFPMMVQSGEKVQVTPKGAVGQDGKLLSAIVGRLDALNMNVIQSRPIVNNNVNVRGVEFTKNTIVPSEKKIDKTGYNYTGGGN